MTSTRYTYNVQLVVPETVVVAEFVVSVQVADDSDGEALVEGCKAGVCPWHSVRRAVPAWDQRRRLGQFTDDGFGTFNFVLGVESWPRAL